jgi:hypothetical protein
LQQIFDTHRLGMLQVIDLKTFGKQQKIILTHRKFRGQRVSAMTLPWDEKRKRSRYDEAMR